MSSPNRILVLPDGTWHDHAWSDVAEVAEEYERVADRKPLVCIKCDAILGTDDVISHAKTFVLAHRCVQP